MRSSSSSSDWSPRTRVAEHESEYMAIRLRTIAIEQLREVTRALSLLRGERARRARRARRLLPKLRQPRRRELQSSGQDQEALRPD